VNSGWNREQSTHFEVVGNSGMETTVTPPLPPPREVIFQFTLRNGYKNADKGNPGPRGGGYVCSTEGPTPR